MSTGRLVAPRRAPLDSLLTRSAMVLSRPALIASLQDEVRILEHLIGKVEPGMHDWRPTPSQRSVAELGRHKALYLKSCGLTHLDSANLWMGMDSPAS